MLRQRIRSVQSTRKITKAMELIAASRIVRAQARIAANRPYRDGMERILRITAAADPEAATKLLGTPESPSRVGILAIVGDRGLAGSYNSGVLRATERLVAEHSPQRGRGHRVDRSGRRRPPTCATGAWRRAQSFLGLADRPEFADARDIAATVAAPFVAGEVDLIQMVSTRFISAGTQRVETLQVLPLPVPEEAEATTATTSGRRTVGATPSSSPSPRNCWPSWPPGRSRPRSSPPCSEGAAAFFTAQQRAMAAATDNADELVRTLTRVMNRARQDAITTEIMEIVGGAEALRQSKGA